MKTFDKIKQYIGYVAAVLLLFGWIYSAGRKSTKDEAIKSELLSIQSKLSSIEDGQKATDEKVIGNQVTLDLIIKMFEK